MGGTIINADYYCRRMTKSCMCNDCLQITFMFSCGVYIAYNIKIGVLNINGLISEYVNYVYN